MINSHKIRAVGLAAVLILSVFAVLIVPVEETPAIDRELTDGRTYWQGSVLEGKNVTSPNESVTVENIDTGVTVLSLTADSDGDVVIDTSSLDGRYYLNNSSGGIILEFRVAVQQLSADYLELELAYGGEVKNVVLGIDSNRGSFNTSLSGDGLNLTERVQGAKEVNGSTIVELHGGEEMEINVSDLEGGNYTIEGDVVDSTASFSVIIDISNPPSYGYAFPDTSPDFPNDTLAFEDGGEYWRGQLVVYGNASPNEVYTIYDSAGNLVRERVADSSGNLNITTETLEGDYILYNSTSGENLGQFTVKTHTLEIAPGDTTLETGEMTTLSVSTNRNGSDVVIWSDKLNRSQLHEAFPDSVWIENDVVIENLTDGDEIQFQTDALDPGEYLIGFWSLDSMANVTETFVLESPSTPTPTPTDSNTGGGGGGGGGGGDSSGDSTPTDTPTPTPTPTASPIPTATASQTPQPTDSPVVTSDSQTVAETSAAEGDEPTTTREFTTGLTEGPGQDGFGFVAMAAALTVLALRRLQV
jgi:hypothetical protein